MSGLVIATGLATASATKASSPIAEQFGDIPNVTNTTTSLFEKLWLLPLLNSKRFKGKGIEVKLERDGEYLPGMIESNEGLELLCKYYRAHLSYLPRRENSKAVHIDVVTLT